MLRQDLEVFAEVAFGPHADAVTNTKQHASQCSIELLGRENADEEIPNNRLAHWLAVACPPNDIRVQRRAAFGASAATRGWA